MTDDFTTNLHSVPATTSAISSSTCITVRILTYVLTDLYCCTIILPVLHYCIAVDPSLNARFLIGSSSSCRVLI